MQDETKNTPDEKTPIADAVSMAAKEVTEPSLTPETGHNKRTWGNKAFDLVVYPLIAFGAVFGFSLWATYEGRFGKPGKPLKIREGYERLAEEFKKLPFVKNIPDPVVRGKKAKSYAMVTVSFIAGTLLISPIKIFEDYRDKISKYFDRLMGTTPKDPSEYATEPKQSWLSVLGGRVLTFGSVAAVAFSKLGTYIDEGSRVLANQLVSKDRKINDLEHVHTGTFGWKVGFIAAFETFYTALCATMVYFMSRGLARLFNKKDSKHTTAADVVNATLTDSAGGTHSQTPAAPEADKETPRWSGKLTAKPETKKQENFAAAVDASRTGSEQAASI